MFTEPEECICRHEPSKDSYAVDISGYGADYSSQPIEGVQVSVCYCIPAISLRIIFSYISFQSVTGVLDEQVYVLFVDLRMPHCWRDT